MYPPVLATESREVGYSERSKETEIGGGSDAKECRRSIDLLFYGTEINNKRGRIREAE